MQKRFAECPGVLAHCATATIFSTIIAFGAPFILFLDELGLPKTQIGFIQSLMPFCGILALFTAPVVARVGVKRTFFVFWGARHLVYSALLGTQPDGSEATENAVNVRDFGALGDGPQR